MREGREKREENPGEPPLQPSESRGDFSPRSRRSAAGTGLFINPRLSQAVTQLGVAARRLASCRPPLTVVPRARRLSFSPGILDDTGDRVLRPLPRS